MRLIQKAPTFDDVLVPAFSQVPPGRTRPLKTTRSSPSNIR